MRASAQVMSDIHEMKKGEQPLNLKKCENTLIDGFVFSSALYESISFQRKELIRPCIPKPYDKICHRSTITDNNEFLFGSELMDDIKKATEEKKLYDVLKPKAKNYTESRHGQPTQQQKDQPYPKTQYGKGTFQKRGGGTNQFQRPQQPQQQQQFQSYNHYDQKLDGSIFKKSKGYQQKPNTWNTKGREPPRRN